MNAHTLYVKVKDHRFIFSFLKYVQPVWYFNLKPVVEPIAYWVDYNKLADEDRNLIELDDGYLAKQSSLRDAAYQAFHKGIMCKDESMALTIETTFCLPVYDEYRFLRKYYHPVWSVYVLFLRLITFKYPVKELDAFRKARATQRVSLFDSVKSYPGFAGTAISSDRLVSIIIPTLNRYAYLTDVLKDLEKQTYKNLEVIVVDQSSPFHDEVYANCSLNLTVIQQKEKALWLARNTAISRARGELILLYDDDSRVEPDWITNHIRCIDFFGADISAGVSISQVGAKVPRHYSFFRWADQLDTGNVMLRREVFERIGLFDRQFEKQRMGDGEFGLRACLAGCISISNPMAKRLHLKVESGGLRQMGSWDGFRPTNLLAPRPIPSVLYLSRRYFGNRLSVFNLLIKVPASVVPLRFKNKPFLLFIGSLVSVLVFPLVLFQVVRSWRQAGEKLKAGPIIDFLKV